MQIKKIKKKQSHDKDQIIRKKKRVKVPKDHKKLKRVLIPVCIALGLVALIIAAFFLLKCSGENSLKNSAQQVSEGKIVEYNGDTYVYNENIVSMLMIGYDQTLTDETNGKSGQSDFLMLFTLDTKTGQIQALSIPRDTMVEAAQFVGEGYIGLDKKMQIALSYAYGDGSTTSCQNTVDSVSRLLYNMPINKYLALNLEGIAPINDSVGGVLVDALETIPNTPIHKGEQIVLMGNNARKYVQYRDKKDTYSSENRRQRQAQYVQSFFGNSVLKADNIPATIVSLFNTASKYIVTNVGLDEVTYIANLIYTNHSKLEKMQTVPGEYAQGQSLIEYNPNSDKLYEIVLNMFYIKQ